MEQWLRAVEWNGGWGVGCAELTVATFTWRCSESHDLYLNTVCPSRRPPASGWSPPRCFMLRVPRLVANGGHCFEVLTEVRRYERLVLERHGMGGMRPAESERPICSIERAMPPPRALTLHVVGLLYSQRQS